MNEVTQIPIKRGDTFSFGSTELPLPTGQAWTARAQVRDPLVPDAAPPVCELSVRLTPPTPPAVLWDLWLFAPAQATVTWPVGPNYARPRVLVCDVQFTRADQPHIVVTSSTFQILVYRDVTQAEVPVGSLVANQVSSS